jgi:hypothetical protein
LIKINLKKQVTTSSKTTTTTKHEKDGQAKMGIKKAKRPDADANGQ